MEIQDNFLNGERVYICACCDEPFETQDACLQHESSKASFKADPDAVTAAPAAAPAAKDGSESGRGPSRMTQARLEELEYYAASLNEWDDWGKLEEALSEIRFCWFEKQRVENEIAAVISSLQQEPSPVLTMVVTDRLQVLLTELTKHPRRD